MRWTPSNRGEDLEDRRSQRGGGGGGIRVGLGGLLVLGVLSLIFRTDLISPFLGSAGGDPASSQPDPARDAAEEPLARFAHAITTDANDFWTATLQPQGVEYPRAPVVLFRQAVSSGCGSAESAMGPFYCPADQKLYIDLEFYEELHNKFGAPGDFAQAYVLAHEVGHHVQNVLGIERKMRAAQRANPAAQNELSVRMELQADCFAGLWGKSSDQRGNLDPNEAKEALDAAAAIGDDRLQKQATGQVSPESFTHGTSAQRVEWFRRGFEASSLSACDTFGDALR